MIGITRQNARLDWPQKSALSGLRVACGCSIKQSGHWVETRMNPCLDGLNSENGIEFVFKVPSPGKFV
jgi:hypothetical protein